MVLFALSLIGLGVSTDLTNIESIFPQDDAINVEGDLDMNSNNINNFFSSGCSGGEVMVGVDDDGSYECVDVSSEVSGDYVDRDGDSMTGSLDMSGNAVTDISRLSTDGSVDFERSGEQFIRFSSHPSIQFYEEIRVHDDIDMNGNDIEDVSRMNVEDGFQVPVGEDAW